MVTRGWGSNNRAGECCGPQGHIGRRPGRGRRELGQPPGRARGRAAKLSGTGEDGKSGRAPEPRFSAQHCPLMAAPAKAPEGAASSSDAAFPPWQTPPPARHRGRGVLRGGGARGATGKGFPGRGLRIEVEVSASRQGRRTSETGGTTPQAREGALRPAATRALAPPRRAQRRRGERAAPGPLGRGLVTRRHCSPLWQPIGSTLPPFSGQETGPGAGSRRTLTLGQSGCVKSRATCGLQSRSAYVLRRCMPKILVALGRTFWTGPRDPAR